MRVEICINGRGNAWPVALGGAGSRHERLSRIPAEYANTSFSIRALDPERVPRWEVVFDAGQGIAPAIVQRGNRLPDALILSHPHLDHVCGIDWLAASHARHGDGRLAVYTSAPCWRDVVGRFPWVEEWVELHVLRPGVRVEVDEAPGLVLTSHPVYHGDVAPGASLTVAEIEHPDGNVKVVLTGDLLCPLLRERDLAVMRGADWLFADANTRFPCPASNHWSIVGHGPAGVADEAAPLRDWLARITIDRLVAPHSGARDPTTDDYLADVRRELGARGHRLLMSIADFVDATAPRRVALVHYSGYEDRDYGEAILDDDALLAWIAEASGADAHADAHADVKVAGNVDVEWRVPGAADVIELAKS